MDTTHPIERVGGRPGLAARVLTGGGFGLIALPLLVVADAAARGRSGTDPIVPVVADVLVGGALGLVIGAQRLDWPGLVGAFAGAIGGAALPYMAIPLLIGLAAPDLSGYGEYPPGMVAAAVAASVGMAVGTRSRLRFEIRPVVTIVAGLVVLALWFAFWVVWAQAVRQL